MEPTSPDTRDRRSMSETPKSNLGKFINLFRKRPAQEPAQPAQKPVEISQPTVTQQLETKQVETKKPKITEDKLKEMSWPEVLITLFKDKPVGNNFVELFMEIQSLPLDWVEIIQDFSKIYDPKFPPTSTSYDERWNNEMQTLSSLFDGDYLKSLTGSFSGRPRTLEFINLISSISKSHGDTEPISSAQRSHWAHNLVRSIPSVVLEAIPHMQGDEKLPEAFFTRLKKESNKNNHYEYNSERLAEATQLAISPNVPDPIRNQIVKGLGI